MALNPSIPPGSRWAASPAAGRLPGDPYYKLALQAELNRRERMPMEGKVTAAASTTASTTQGVESPVSIHWSPSAAVVKPSNPAPCAEKVDSIVINHQAESEAWLQMVAPAALGEFQLAAERLREAADAVGSKQAGLLAQGLESLRRGLRKLADSLYAPTKGRVEDRFGQMRRTDDGGYISRIGLALQQAKMSDGRHSLEKAELDNFVHRFAALNGRLGDNVHGDCNFMESRSLYVDAWRVVATCRLYLAS